MSWRFKEYTQPPMAAIHTSNTAIVIIYGAVLFCFGLPGSIAACPTPCFSWRGARDKKIGFSSSMFPPLVHDGAPSYHTGVPADIFRSFSFFMLNGPAWSVPACIKYF